VDPEVWLTETPLKSGSWWPEWIAWLDGNSCAVVTPPKTGCPSLGYAPLCDAPGTYVMQA